MTALFARRASGDVVDRAVSAVASFGELAQCADTEALTAEVPPPANADTRGQVARLEKRLATARALQAAGSYKEGRIVAEEVVRSAENVDYPPLLARALVLAAALEDDDGDAKTAEGSLRRAIAVAAAAGDDRTAAKAWVQLLWVVGYKRSARTDITNLRLGAESAVARAGTPPRIHGRLLSNLASVMYTRGKYDQARALFERALSLQEKTRSNSLDVASTLNNLGLVHYKQGKYERAASYHRRVLAIREARLGRDHPMVASALNNLGITTERQGKYEEARAYFRRALTIKEATLGAEHPTLAGTLNNLGNTYMQTGDTETAIGILRRALSLKEKGYGKDHPRVALTLDNLAEAMIRSKRYREAQRLLERSLAISRKALGENHPETAYTLTSLAEAYLGLGDAITAEALAERSLTIRVRAKVPPVQLAETQLVVARALWARNRQKPRALRLARSARAAFAAAGSSGKRGLAKANAWLRSRGR
jgi:serine/threonine-protein kinase